ncbi:hypothetical protein GJ688_17675 [Heliobacillus mobilis]|uniref:Uncharacterized protein n=1 Tax=Heliobacterium mobile TaxID=28064 RepID=A0A6I3SP00_HELMO|nr:hypothetical protein [Heliobacterium mobile]MTV50764.1 hypothetical protein [Heliobacterium mobile]
MFGANEMVLAYIRRLVGSKTDRLDPNGSLHAKMKASMFSGLFFLNDGTDGAMTHSSTTTVESGVYRLSSLSINSGVTIFPTSSFLCFLVQGTATINGTISASGKGSAGGVNPQSTNANGTNGLDGYGACGAGGDGGNFSTFTKGLGGNTDVLSGVPGSNCTKWGRFGGDVRQLLSFQGGGGGSGACTVYSSGSSRGGTGGNGGGVILILADTITGTGAIRADGTAGANGYSSGNYAGSNGGGGGGGGGGGSIILIGKTISVPTLSANGGSAGTSSGGTTVAGAGGNGSIIRITY